MWHRQTDIIAVEGVNGDYCVISHPDFTWGPYLAPRSTGLFDLPVQTNWGTGPFGQFFQSWKPKRRDVVWTIHVINPDTGTEIDEDSDLWHTIYSRWRNMFSEEDEATITYTSVDGERRLGLRTLQAPQSLSAQNFEGVDPHRFAYGSVVQTMAAELPFYVGSPQSWQWATPATGNFWLRLPFFNPGSVDIWPEWDLDGGATWVLPDYSFGSEIYGRGVNDLGKTVPIPELLLGENVTVMTRPDMEWIISEWETSPWMRSPGKRHEYPIRPGRGSSETDGPNPGCVVRCLGATAEGLRATLTLPRWYREPFSTPRLV
jgi:hypothetical protein